MAQLKTGTTIAGSTAWHQGNDGAGSGLDADLLDGQQGSYYASTSALSSYLPLSGGTLTGDVTFQANAVYQSNIFDTPILSTASDISVAENAAGKVIVVNSGSAVTVTFDTAAVGGFAITIIRKGAGDVVIANTTALAKLNTASFTTSNISAQYESATVVYTATNEIFLLGSIT